MSSLDVVIMIVATIGATLFVRRRLNQINKMERDAQKALRIYLSEQLRKDTDES